MYNINLDFALQLLGVYTFTRKVTLDEFETKPRKTSVCCKIILLFTVVFLAR